MTTRDARRRGFTGLGVAALVTAGLIPVAPAAAQDCGQELAAIEQQMQRATDLTGRQREYIRDLIDSARTFAANGNQGACMRTVGDIAEYAQEESLDMAVARQANDRAPFVADTPENLREQPPQPRIEVPDPTVRVGESSVPLPVPEPRVTVEPAEPEVTVERSEPNVTIEQAEPRVTIERIPAGG